SEPGSTTTTADGAATTTTTPGPVTTVPPTGPQPEILPAIDGSTCLVGPSGGTGEVFSRDSAAVDLDPTQGWTVNVGLSAEGEGTWNQIAGECYSGLASCPSRQLAIVLDGIVQSHPQVNAPFFSGEVSVSGSFTEDEARSLARVLNRGAFPVDVVVQRVETVSPTLGQDALRASVFAGLVGIVALLGLLYVFYRRLTLLIALGLVVWGMLIYSIASIISQTTNFALTLAGVTGIVVSIGITVDSYVIYFERLKDEVVHGRTLRNSAGRSFRATWRTILAANLVAFIAAAVLFVLSVGSVRGFALYLGITTICDVLVLYFFTRPAVVLLAETGRLDRRDTFGLGLKPTEVRP
ncbi:MAG: preprotein translocase subunit SecD, partial [Ilumatobacteraceae bacterium]